MTTTTEPIAPSETAPAAGEPALSRPGLLVRLGSALTPVRAGALIVLALGTFQLLTMDRYGVTSDAPGIFYAGDRTLFWMQNPGQKGALDFLGDEPAGFHSPFGREPDWYDPVHYPVLPGLVGAITNWIFHIKLGWVDHVDGHHLGLLLINALAMLLFCVYACRLLGRGAGIAATIALALFPLAVGHAPNNPKDWPCAQLYGLTLLAAGVGVIEGRARHLIVAGVLFGLALAAKLNAAFIVPTLLVWAPVAWFALHHKRQPVSAGVVGGFLLAPYLACLVFFISWPWLYYGRLPQWWAHFSEYVRFMVTYGSGARMTFTSFPFTVVALMTPPLVLFSALLWIAVGWRGGRRQVALWSLLVLWFAVPIVRTMLPGSNFYDANRHFIEYVPALCALAGAGFAWAMRRLWGWLARGPRAALLGGRLPEAGVGAACVLALGCVVWPVAEYHPYETTYFNSFIGGLGKAQQAGLFYYPPPQDVRINGTEGDYWFSSSREGSRDLRALMKPGDKISMCGPGREHAKANWAVQPIPYLYETHEPDFDRTAYMYVSPRETLCWWRQVRQLESERPIIKRVERGGGLIYEILGRKDGVVRTPVSPETEYERRSHPHDRVGWELKQKRDAQRAAPAAP